MCFLTFMASMKELKTDFPKPPFTDYFEKDVNPFVIRTEIYTHMKM